ncbi:MAG: hexitol phosphatase HxpB [Bacteroidales bacterium]|nr:hexitol phosphatase HxpB [Bacteroidales bacterium]
MLESVIFDLDGIIIDSEALWRDAEIKVFKSVGIDLSPELCRQTTGLDMQATIQYWYNHFPWENKSLFQVYKELMEIIQPAYEEDAELMEGFLDVLQFFKDSGITAAIASSTPLKLIMAALKKFHLFDFFKIIHSSENDEFCKPHPSVYIQTARKLNIPALHCLAFEDSFNGAIAAKAACMKVVVIPDSHNINSTRFDFADLKLESLKDFKPRHFEQLNT